MLSHNTKNHQSRRFQISIIFCLLVFGAGFIGTQLGIGSHSAKDKSLPTSVGKYLKEKQQRKLAGQVKVEMPEQMAIINKQLRTPRDRKSPEYASNYLIKAIKEGKKGGRLKSADEVFTERGPANVAGRTRAILVSQKDINRNTWLAGSASGGIWKTIDSGVTWSHKTNDLPNLGTNTLANSISNPDVVYAGTGEPFTGDIDGAGMFKSYDFGETWEQIVDPEVYPDFRNVNRIIVDPEDENIIVAITRNSVWEEATTSAIFKSIDGGESWNRTRTSSSIFADINHNPQNFNTQYVAVNGVGVLKSSDAGETWFFKSSGLEPLGRIEIDVSPVDTALIWASVVGTRSGNFSDLYVSKDAAENWEIALDADGGENPDFLGGQGWYDNIITAHPKNANIAYVGGVDLWKFTLTGKKNEAEVFNLIENNTRSFLSFVNGNSIGGGAIFGNVPDANLNSIEVRFGQGSQLAHRFTVSLQGPGVPASQYLYQDYVEVPFQVWDTDNNRQLMVSFRDQQEDGAWDLKPINTGAPHEDDSREYIFVHDMPYSDSSSAVIGIDGGHDIENMYFFWTHLNTGVVFNPTNLPVSNIAIKKELISNLERVTTNISDAYDRYAGRNTFSDANFENNEGVHPDQHNIVPIVIRSELEFRLLVSNDGGIYLTDKSLDPGFEEGSFNYVGFGYNTTQFYGADKAPNEDLYIGGMQDNSTWFTPAGVGEVTEKTSYSFAFGGDGFEALWNNRDAKQLIGSIQFNNFQRSINGGITWNNATSGISDNSPFISRLANSKRFPDRIFTIGSSGVWVSADFGSTWNVTPISDMWSYNNSADIQVSGANFDVVWAGGALDEVNRLQVSTNGGYSFTATNYYEESELGFCSGIGTHPFEANTAYALFSFSGRAKVLKTEDLGQSWADISGFEGSENGKSKRGFPNVAVSTIFVFPNDTNRIWVGSEIGIIESKDGGLSWNILETDLGAAYVYDFKLQDDQLVIATYGRGIWTATIIGIEQSYVFSPNVQSAVVAPLGGMNTQVLFPEVYDSVQIYLNDALIQTIIENQVGVSQYVLDNTLGDGENSLKMIGFIDSLSYPSNVRVFEVVNYGAPVTEYITEFSDEITASDFGGNGFYVAIIDGFENAAAHTLHPYPDQQDLLLNFRRPVLIEGEQILSYKDVAIIEKGENGSVFGSVDFYDFVVIESSLDGINWTPIRDGYDASFNADWLSAYNLNAAGSSELFVAHEISLSEQFEQGDIVLLRFRLSADPAANGWGWAIDDFIIAKEMTTPIIEIEVTAMKIYPNPTSDRIWIDIDKSLNYKKAQISNISGQIQGSWSLEGLQHLEIDVTQYAPGVYLMKLGNERDQTIQQIVITR
ncbi:MAG: photosystem II stability/assembly factor-like uncharacterized protein [Saprospiraceae bacterium]|jgi:photosystem II stability/assembly factor-like uncharacterized protein